MQGERPRELAGPDVWETCRELIPAGSINLGLTRTTDGTWALA